MDFEKGNPIAHIKSLNPSLNNELLYINLNNIDNDLRREIKFDKNTNLTPLPIININGEKQNTRLFVSGPSGSGKSTFTNQFLKTYLKLNTNKKIFYISRLSDDPAFNDLTMKKINCNTDEILDYNPEFFVNSIVVFDDFETVKDKNLLNHTLNLRDVILETGRHSNTDIVVIQHQLMNNHKTKLVHFESNMVVLFPKSNFQPIKNYLKNYVGNDNVLFDKIKKIKGRWMLYSKNYPQFIMGESECFLV